MKKFKFVLTPLLAVSFLTNCGGNKKPSLLETPLTFTCIDAGEDDKASIIKKAIALRSLGWSYRKIAKELGVSDKTVGRWIKLNS